MCLRDLSKLVLKDLFEFTRIYLHILLLLNIYISNFSFVPKILQQPCICPVGFLKYIINSNCDSNVIDITINLDQGNYKAYLE